jgi:hypothetical protein
MERAAGAALAGVARGALAALAVLSAAGCREDASAVVDSLPIPLIRAPMGGGLPGEGALLAKASLPDGTPFDMVVDTGSSLTILQGPALAQPQSVRGGFNLLDAASSRDPQPPRAIFRGINLLQVPLAPIGDGSKMPLGALGGDLLRGYSVGFRFGASCTVGGVASTCSSMTFWTHLGADTAFLEDAGYAVYRFSLYGGGELTVNGEADFLGLRGPLVIPPTRLSLRTCAVPAAFSPDMPISTCCTAADAAAQATGVNLSLLLATGVGPLVLSRSAWGRIVQAAGALAEPISLTPPTSETPSLFVATWPTAISAGWTTIPRIAIVDLEAGPANDPGACVELARSRRTEQVEFRTATDPESDVCGQPCDADLRERDKAQSSAAYLELNGQIPVAVIADDDPLLQALRFDVRPEGPELDGLVGAGALGRSRVEIDYLSAQPRALFSCEIDAPRTACWSAARCPRLPDHDSVHYCFNLGPQKLPATCAPSTCPDR